MFQLLAALSLVTSAPSAHAYAEINNADQSAADQLIVEVTDVTAEYEASAAKSQIVFPDFPSLLPTPTPASPNATPAPGASPSATPAGGIKLPTFPIPGAGNNGGGVGHSDPGGLSDTPITDWRKITINDIVTIGTKLWNFVIDNKPNAQYESVKTSVIPAGITSWTQLTGWTAPVSKVYHVEFKNIFGFSAGGFDYRISFVPNGNVQGKGKFLGELSFVPSNITIHTGRSLNVKAEISNPINFGSETDPVAGVSMTVTWTTPTFTHYSMTSAQYYIYGNGIVQDITQGNK